MDPPTLKDVVLGQYAKSSDNVHNAYIDEEDVPKDSSTETYAIIKTTIRNSLWNGIPMILKAGKGLNESKVEIRIQFRQQKNCLYSEAERNELVIRVQPKEAIYLKLNIKKPGHESNLAISELDLSYNNRYSDAYIPDAYESLLLEASLGSHVNFVGEEELIESWKLFDALFTEMKITKPTLHKYPFGSRGPQEGDKFIESMGYKRNTAKYVWP